MVEIKNVCFSYNSECTKGSIENLNINIKPGECVLLCGKSGCGKTTITKLINGLIPHFISGELKGTTTVSGMNVEETPMYLLSRKIGSVFQNPKSQFFNIDSDSELAFGPENNGEDPEVIRKRIAATIEELDIAHLLNRNIFRMSGGEKQSLAFASVYAMNPDVYVLDEPSANLDYEATAILGKQLAHIKEQGKNIIIAEHRLYYLAELIDRALLIEDGHIVREFTHAEFVSMTDEERAELGLRTLTDKKPVVKPAEKTGGDLEVRNLCVRACGKTIFENVNFSASRGDIIGVIGHNGAGKTTLMRCLAGLIKENGGEIIFDGRPVGKKGRNALCYMIMQDVNHQLFGESVLDECGLSLDKNMNPGDIEKVLSEFDLEDFKNKHPMALSGGQKQRLAIVTGILADRDILIFDEPTSGLDHDHMCVVSDTIRKLADAGHIVFVVTHDMEFMEITCNRAVQF